MLDQKKLRIFRGFLLFSVIAFFFWASYQLSSITNPLLIALLLTYISDPFITRLEKVFKHRLVAVIAIYVYLFLFFVFIPVIVMGRLYTESRSLYVTLVGERITDINHNHKWDEGEYFTDLNNDGIAQPDELFLDLNNNGKFDKSEDAYFYRIVDRAGKYARSVDPETRQYVEQAVDVNRLTVYLKNNIRDIASTGGRFTKWLFNKISYSVQSFSAFVSLFILIPMYTFFFLYEWNDIKNTVKRYLPAFYKARILEIVGKIDRAVSSFFRGRLIMCILKSLIIAIGLWICGIRFSLFIGIMAGFLSIIPFLGPIVGAIPAFTFVVIDYNSSPYSFISVIIAFLVAEFIEGVILQPMILGAETGLHPITLIISFMVFGKLLGLFGLLLAVPLMAIVKILGIEFILPVMEEFAEKAGDEEPGDPVIETDSAEDGKSTGSDDETAGDSDTESSV